MIVVRAPGTVEADRACLSLQEVDAGVLAFSAEPWSRTSGGLVGQAIRALGLDTGEGGFVPTEIRRMIAWLRAYRITDIHVLHGDLYPPDVLLEFDELLIEPRIRLWLVVEPTHLRRLQAELADSLENELDWDAYLDRARRAAPAIIEETSTPLDTRPMWLAEYRRLTSESLRPECDHSAYVAGFWTAAGWPPFGRDGRSKAAYNLRAVLEPLKDLSYAARFVRGAAVALRQAGWEIKLDLRKLSGGPPLAPRLGSGPFVIESLSQWRRPLQCVSVALTGLGLAPLEMLGLHCADVASDGSSVRLGSVRIDVPLRTRPILRAQLYMRADEDAELSDPFIAEGARQMSVKRLVGIITATLEEMGISIPEQELLDRPTGDERWLAERGIRLSWLSRGDRPARRVGLNPHETKEAIRAALASDRHLTESCSCQQSHGARRKAV